MKIKDIEKELGISITEIKKKLEEGGFYRKIGETITEKEYIYLKEENKKQAGSAKKDVTKSFSEKKYKQEDNFIFETISFNDDLCDGELLFHSPTESENKYSEDVIVNNYTSQESLNSNAGEHDISNLNKTESDNINTVKTPTQKEVKEKVILQSEEEKEKEHIDKSEKKTNTQQKKWQVTSNSYKPKPTIANKKFSKEGNIQDESEDKSKDNNKQKGNKKPVEVSGNGKKNKYGDGNKQSCIVYHNRINIENIKKFKLLKKAKNKNKTTKKTTYDKKIVVSNNVSLKNLAGLLNCNAEELINICHDLDIPISTQYQTLEKDVIVLLAGEYDYDVSFPEIEDKGKEVIQNSKKRKPIITVVGHVDHGKTTLVDYICKSLVAKSEQGGITQNINAYNVKTKNGEEFTLIDTPGHKIFTEMRARAINLADIAIVIIAADSGVQDQTKEILQQITFFGKPVVFAFNKIDKPGANIDKIKEVLASLNFIVEDWGGNYQCQGISALSGEGVGDLLEKIMIEAFVLDLNVDYDCPAKGIILDSFFEKNNGYQNKVLIKEGTLKECDFIVAGNLYGKIRQIKKGNAITKEVLPSESAIITGISGCAQPGEIFTTVKNEREAREIAERYQQILREQHANAQQKITFDMLKRRKLEGEKKKIGIIVNACSKDIGRVILELLSNFSSDKYSIEVIKENTGEILTADVDTAISSKAIIIGFNVKISSTTLKYAEKNNVTIKSYNVIYDLAEHIEEILELHEGKNKELKNVGKAEVLQIFKIKKVGTIAGCVIREGIAHIKDIVCVNRNGKIIFSGNIKSMKHGPVDITEAKLDTECGVCINRYDDVKKGDFLEFMQRQ